jgi:CubicO group peptidase (beta-lactamase class C family)
VIEHVTGMRYADFIASSILGPIKMSATFQGSSFLSGRHAGEARYFPCPGEPQRKSVFPPFNPVDAPYGSFDLENMDSYGGWVSSVLDLLGFVNGVFEGGYLNPSSIAEITTNSISSGATGASWGLGWGLAAARSGFNFWHNGVLNGTTSYVVRTTWSDGSHVVSAAVMNMRDGGRTQGPAAAGRPFAGLFGKQQHVAYLDANGLIQDAWYDSGTNLWNLQQINMIGVTAGLPAVGNPYVSVFGEQLQFHRSRRERNDSGCVVRQRKQ